LETTAAFSIVARIVSTADVQAYFHMRMLLTTTNYLALCRGCGNQIIFTANSSLVPPAVQDEYLQAFALYNAYMVDLLQTLNRDDAHLNQRRPVTRRAHRYSCHAEARRRLHGRPARHVETVSQLAENVCADGLLEADGVSLDRGLARWRPLRGRARDALLRHP